MPKEVKLAGLRTLLAGGTDRLGGGTGPVVCLFHGYGANAEDLCGLWRVLDVPRGVRFAFAEAPLSLSEMFGFPSFAWWHIDVGRFNAAVAGHAPMDSLYDEEPPGLVQTRARALQWLESLRAGLGGVPLSQVVLGGFSQGAMLAVDVALHLPGPLAGLVALSGAPVNRRAWRAAQAHPTRRFQSHGMEDEILPFEVGVALDEFLREAGFPGDLYRFHGGHEISAGVLESLGCFLTACTDAP